MIGKLLTTYQLGEYQERGFLGITALDDFIFKVDLRSTFQRTSEYQAHTMQFPLRCAVLFLFVLGHTFAAEAFVRTVGKGKRWAVGNDMISRTVSFSSTDGLRTESLKHLVTGTDFTTQSTGNVEFSFDASGRHVDGHSKWALTEATTVALVSGKALRVQLRDERDGLDVAVFYAAYDDEPAVRQWLQIRNTG